MRASGFRAALVVFVTVLAVASAASAKERKPRGGKTKREQPVVEQPVVPEEPEPEPEPVQESGWDQSGGWDRGASEPQPEAPAHEPEDAAPLAPPSWWFGAYLNGVFIPSFLLSPFFSEAPTIGNAGFGVTATHRSESGFSVVLGLGYIGYGFAGPLQKAGDPEEDTEFVESSLGLLHLRGQLLWSAQVHEMVAIEYGLGLDIGLVTGELRRSEAYRDASGEFRPCVGPGNPLTVAPSGQLYCEPALRNGMPVPTNAYDEFGAHYGVVERRIPPVFAMPMLPVLALRVTPVRNVALRLEASYGIFQFAIGLSAAYGVDL